MQTLIITFVSHQTILDNLKKLFKWIFDFVRVVGLQFSFHFRIQKVTTKKFYKIQMFFISPCVIMSTFSIILSGIVW